MDGHRIILTITQVPIWASTIYAIRYYNRFGSELRAFTWFLMLSAVVQQVSMVLSLMSINNMLLLHGYVPIATMALFWFYQQVFRDLVPKWLFPVSSLIFATVALINIFWFEPWNTFSSNTLTLQAILITILAMALFILLLDEQFRASGSGTLASLNWINSGLLFYFSSNLVLSYFGDWLTTLSTDNFLSGWMLHSFISIILYTCVFFGLWKHPRNQTS